MSRIDIDQCTVLKTVTDHLRNELRLNERTCFESLINPRNASPPAGGSIFVTVSPGPGDFPPGEQAPGNITEEWSVIVTIWSRIDLDSTGHDEALLRDSVRGLYSLKLQVLKALVGEDLETEDGDTFLRQLLHVTGCSAPASGNYGGTNMAYLQLQFGISFDWDLT